MTRKEKAARQTELNKMYKEAIGDFRKFFENKKKLMKAKKENKPPEDVQPDSE